MNRESLSLQDSDPRARIARLHRLPRLMLFVALTAWYFGARALAGSAANGLAFRFRLVSGRVLLEACFHLFLLAIGYVTIQMVGRQQVLPLTDLVALPRRETAGREWLTGAALGWGMVAAGLLPLVLLGRLHTQLSFGWGEIKVAALAVAVLGVTALTHEMAFRGYPFRCLIEAIGPTFAVLAMVVGAGISAWHNAWIPGTAVIASMLLTLLLSITWLRTRAVWFAWGLHFSLVASGSVLFGLPVGGGTGFASVVRSGAYGADWLTGGEFGPVAAVFSIAVLLAAIVVLYRVTREYAWNYTHTPIVARGYEVKVATPAAHGEMEAKAAPGPALVQILSSTPTSFSAESGHAVSSAPSLPDRLP